jgi:hypothetical protein
MRDLPPSPAELNRRNREFWEGESERAARRASEPLLLELAMEEQKSEALRGFPVYGQKTLERALADAEKRKERVKSAIRSEIRAEDGRRGGRPRRGDELQVLIEKIVARLPNITVSILLERLRDLQYLREVIEDIDDDEIHFKHGEDQTRSAPISGLKHRLARARKSVPSRKPVSAKP